MGLQSPLSFPGLDLLLIQNPNILLMQKKAFVLTALIGTGLFSASVSAEFHRGYVSIVGSNAVAPYAKAVGEKISKAKKVQMPLVQPTGTNGGIKLFCEGLGPESPDVVVTARPMKQKEKDECRSHGLDDILEVKIGYDGLVLAQSKKAPPLALTRKEARKALAKWLVDDSNKMVLNPHKTWKDVNPAFPDTPIEVYGPSPVSGAYDALVDLVSDLECKGRPWVPEGKTELTPDMLKKCRAIREDGVYIEGRENDEEFAARLGSAPGKIAIYDFELLQASAAHSRAIPIDGVEPDAASIANKAYAGSRPLLVYVKKASIGGTPGLKDFVAEISSEGAIGERGYLKSLGLIPMPSDERATYVAEVKGLGIDPVSVGGGAPAGKASKASKASKAAGKTANAKAKSKK
jgi:phosphate transport system substrate-binding protein